MANVMRYRRGAQIQRWIAKDTTTTAIEIGDLIIDNESGLATPADESADSTGLIGVAMSASPATDPSGTKVRILAPGAGTVFEYETTVKDKYVAGDRFKISAAQVLIQLDTWTNTIAVLAESMDASSTTVLVSFLDAKYQRQTSNTGAGGV